MLFLFLIVFCTTISSAAGRRENGIGHGTLQHSLRIVNETNAKDTGFWTTHPNGTTSTTSISLASLTQPDSDFTTFSHSSLPEYSIRIRRADFCDPTVNTYTGYIDIGARHLFFFYFESRRDPATDDLMLWLNGGPGGSATIGLFMELGPCLIDGPNGTRWNQFGWNDHANLLFIDQPVGVGFSYADYGESVGTTEDAAVDIAAFMAIFMSSVEGLAGKPFHIAGESYGGRYVPLFAAEIYDQNSRLKDTGLEPINLSSVLIGNGMTHFYHMQAGWFEMQCTNASGLGALQSIEKCIRMKEALPRCQKWVQQSCIDVWDEMNCGAANAFCVNELFENWLLTDRSYYDMSKRCEGELMETLCYPATVDIAHYLSLTSTLRTLHVDSGHPFGGVVSWPVNTAFSISGDIFRNSAHHVEALLERGVRVLIYVGEYDLSCNWVGNLAMTENLEWTGQKGFVDAEMRGWGMGWLEEEGAGWTRTSGPLTFATIKGAGHMVPLDKPREGLALVNRWLAKEPL